MLKLHGYLLFYPKNIELFPFGFENIHSSEKNDPVTLALFQYGTYIIQDLNDINFTCQQVYNQKNNSFRNTCTMIPSSVTILSRSMSDTNGMFFIILVFFIHWRKVKVEPFVKTCDYWQRNKNLGPANESYPQEMMLLCLGGEIVLILLVLVLN